MPMKAGRAIRVFSGYTEFWINSRCYTLTKKAGSDLCRYGWTVLLPPEGTIRPEREGIFEIVLPEGVFFAYANHLRRTIDPKGGRNFAHIYEKSVTPCQEV